MLLSTRWIKPLKRHKAGQQTAHLIPHFKTMGAANHMIRDSLVIAGKWTWARHMRKEPRRCPICQLLTARHLVAECNQQTACGTCSKDHCTAQCTKTERDHFRCVNCNLQGHTSWDRMCSTFLVTCKCLEKTDPEHSYKFFPSQDAWTWEQEPNHKDSGQ